MTAHAKQAEMQAIGCDHGAPQANHMGKQGQGAGNQDGLPGRLALPAKLGKDNQAGQSVKREGGNATDHGKRHGG